MRYIRSLVSYLWIAPFISFLFGYYVMRKFSLQENLQAPSVIGNHIHDAIKILSTNNLNVRILAEKEELDIPQGIVINQSPEGYQSVKPHQSVYLVVTCKPEFKNTPNFIGKSIDYIKKLAKQENIYIKEYYLDNVYPKGMCFAQDPCKGQVMKSNTLNIYISSGIDKKRIMPDLRNKSLSDVIYFLNQYEMDYKIFNNNINDIDRSACYIKDQKPLSGSFINIDKPPIIQLTIDKQ